MKLSTEIIRELLDYNPDARQRLETSDWMPVIESLDEYHIRIWQEISL